MPGSPSWAHSSPPPPAAQIHTAFQGNTPCFDSNLSSRKWISARESASSSARPDAHRVQMHRALSCCAGTESAPCAWWKGRRVKSSTWDSSCTMAKTKKFGESTSAHGSRPGSAKGLRNQALSPPLQRSRRGSGSRVPRGRWHRRSGLCGSTARNIKESANGS